MQSRTELIRFVLLAACLFLFSSLAVAGDHDLLSVLSTRRSLDRFASLISTHPTLLAIATAGNYTLLAPTNEAWDTFFSSSTPATNYSTWDDLEDLLSYHILRGVHTRGFITKKPQFLHTYLTNPAHTNVTGGQVVSAILGDDGEPIFGAAVNCKARHVHDEGDLLLLGGVVQVIDTVLSPPMDLYSTIAAAPFPYTLDLMSFSLLNDNFSAIMRNISMFPDMTSIIMNDPMLISAAASIPSTFEEIARIVNYNQIAGQVMYSTKFVNQSKIMTPLGVELTVTISENGTSFLNDAMIKQADVLMSNGVILVLDRWLNASHADARPRYSSLAGNTSSNGTAKSRPDGTPDSKLSLQAKIGIIVGASVAGIIAVVTAAIMYQQRRSHSYQTVFKGDGRPIGPIIHPLPVESAIDDIRSYGDIGNSRDGLIPPPPLEMSTRPPTVVCEHGGEELHMRPRPLVSADHERSSRRGCHQGYS